MGQTRGAYSVVKEMKWAYVKRLVSRTVFNRVLWALCFGLSRVFVVVIT